MLKTYDQATSEERIRTAEKYLGLATAKLRQAEETPRLRDFLVRLARGYRTMADELLDWEKRH